MSHHPDSRFKTYIQAIGRGQKSGRSLTQTEAFDAMSMILRGKVSSLQIGAFLMLLRVREETSEEIAGFTQACRDHLTYPDMLFENAWENSIDIACYAGKRRQLPWFLLAVALLVEQGKKVFMHGSDEPDTNRLYISRVLEELDSSTNMQEVSMSNAKQTIAVNGFCYMDLHSIHPELNQLIQLRSELGLRSCANTLARLINPSRAKFSIQGVHHLHVDQKHMSVAKRLNDNNVLCFRGEGGEPEINPAKDTELMVYRNNQDQHTSSILKAKQSWQIKPKRLDCDELLTLWQTKEEADVCRINTNETYDNKNYSNQSSYGLLAVITTLASYYQLIYKIEHAEALEKARSTWLNRNPNKLFNQLIHNKRLQAVK